MKHVAVSMIGGILLAATACVTPTLAETSQKGRCLYGDLDGLASDQIIEACTAILDSPRTSPGDRVDALIGRRFARRFIDHRRALEDPGIAERYARYGVRP